MKPELRRQVQAAVRAIPNDLRTAYSLRIREGLLSHSKWRHAQTILCFSPLADEPDIWPLVDEALRAEKVVALPRFNASTGAYQSARVLQRSDCVPGKFGALEPNADCPAIPLNHLDLVLVPGIAFDLAGRRLGRGKGFYDRLLAEVRGHKCGVAFDEQIVAQIPEEPHDVRVDSIVTPTRWHLVERAA